jgi:DNA-binding LytR/AlgR family response regulator
MIARAKASSTSGFMAVSREAARVSAVAPARSLYVEFLLRDERRPLMRASLSEIETALGPSGFLRTHRSWVVNPAQVRLLKPSGSGDYRLALEGGAEAPVSRRFPKALAKLKGGG